MNDHIPLAIAPLHDRAPTLKDVGRQAGVSYQTVSRVVNGSSEVHPQTRALVLAAAQQLGFRVNRVAGSLRRNSSQTIGLVMSDVANLFFAEVVGGVEAEAALHNYSLLLANSGENLQQEMAAVTDLLERRVDGLIVAPTEGDHSYMARDLPEQLPVVAINRRIREISCGAVLSDNHGGAKLAVQYLVEQGHRHIGALVGSPGLMTSQERLKGFKAALKAAHLTVHPEWIRFAGLKADTARATALELFGDKNRPTAIFASSNTIAEGALLALRELGLRRDRDVAVIGFDDIPWARLVDPPMPVIAQDTHEIGRRAVRMLLARLADRGSASEIVRLPTRLLTNELPPGQTHASTRANDDTVISSSARKRSKSGLGKPAAGNG